MTICSALKTPNEQTILRRGDHGSEVEELQIKLKREDLDIIVDGNFGPATELAVKVYQTGQQLRSDGIFGPKTWAKFYDSG